MPVRPMRPMRPPAFLDRGTAAAILLIAAAVAGSGSLAWWASGDTAAAPADAAGPVYSATQPDSLILDRRGRPKYRLYADAMRGLARGGRSELTAPRLEIYAEDAPPWFLSAERAWIEEPDRTILLQGKVRIWKSAEEKENAAVCLETEDVRLYPDERRARTRRPVRAYRLGAALAARGMRADLAQGRLELLGEVRGTLAPRAGGGGDPADGGGGKLLRQCLDPGAGPGTAYRDGSGNGRT